MDDSKSGLTDIKSRVHHFDCEFVAMPTNGANELNRKFATLLADISSEGVQDNETKIFKSPTDVDAFVAESAFLKALSDRAPWLDAPSVSSAYQQHWVSTGKPTWAPPQEQRPSADHFKPVSEIRPGASASWRETGGLYSSTATDTFVGMWRNFLDDDSCSGLHPRPWSTWRLEVGSNAKVHSIRTATDWVELLNAHGSNSGGIARVNWASVARIWDAVHFTPRAIVAVEGYRFETLMGLSVPVYWDVESTYWLRWCFDAVELVNFER
ncbi:hypothetical protein [Nocardioides sp. WS12]|uniref:hypothetical protein n=1 Tax=Nocardioides sp. WS12 TaxID=2486272 RepID=UPI0015FAB6A5|nr:hypothetical protein [Nocardioides sp. WS12]